MNTYEFIFITETDKDAQMKDVEALITASEGSVSSKESWGKKQFSYLMNKKTSGYYHIWTVAMASPAVKEFRSKLERNEHVYRSLFLKKN